MKSHDKSYSTSLSAQFSIVVRNTTLSWTSQLGTPELFSSHRCLSHSPHPVCYQLLPLFFFFFFCQRILFTFLKLLNIVWFWIVINYSVAKDIQTFSCICFNILVLYLTILSFSLLFKVIIIVSSDYSILARKKILTVNLMSLIFLMLNQSLFFLPLSLLSSNDKWHA